MATWADASSGHEAGSSESGPPRLPGLGLLAAEGTGGRSTEADSRGSGPHKTIGPSPCSSAGRDGESTPNGPGGSWEHLVSQASSPPEKGGPRTVCTHFRAIPTWWRISRQSLQSMSESSTSSPSGGQGVCLPGSCHGCVHPRIQGRHLALRLDQELTVVALQRALAEHRPAIHHLDIRGTVRVPCLCLYAAGDQWPDQPGYGRRGLAEWVRLTTDTDHQRG